MNYPGEKTRFFLRNLLRGLFWFAILITAFLIIRKNISLDFMELLEPIFDNTTLIITVFSLSELLFGIIPPELFMIWALREEDLQQYIFYISIFSVISYLAGVAGYLFGSYLDTTVYFRYVRKRFLGKYHTLLHKFGFFLILVAAITPLPYSGISMLVGSLRYPMNRFIFWGLARFLRFAVYAFLIWEANLL